MAFAFNYNLDTFLIRRTPSLPNVTVFYDNNSGLQFYTHLIGATVNSKRITITCQVYTLFVYSFTYS